NAMLGMNEILKSKVPPIRRAGASQKSKVVRKIKVKSIDLNALLVDFLSEALYLTQTNKEIYDKIKFEEFTDNELEAKLFGNKIESFGEDIKGVTHHDLKIDQPRLASGEAGQKNGLYEATILFDI
ncbi:MAG: archease, partial [bacterium]|nr:archease [bacterium]